MELVINTEFDGSARIVERDRVVGLDKAVVLEDGFDRSEAGGEVGLDICPKSLYTSVSMSAPMETDLPSKSDKLSCQSPDRKDHRDKSKKVEQVPRYSRPHRAGLGIDNGKRA